MVNVTVNLSGAQKKLSAQSQRKGQYAAANQALASMNPYVPALDHILRNTATIDIDGAGVNYNAPYARKQFYEQHSNYTTPGTGSRWDLRAKSKHMDDIKNAYLRGAGY